VPTAGDVLNVVDDEKSAKEIAEHRNLKERQVELGKNVKESLETLLQRARTGEAKELRLGNIDSARDWGFAGDYVEAMWRMLQQRQPKDYVVGTGQKHTVRDLCAVAFSHVGLDWQKYVKTDPQFVRPAEVDVLLADASRARTELGWTPKVTFEQLVHMMVDADLERMA
jgi:GDPmannose 4,6-dehydratase